MQLDFWQMSSGSVEQVVALVAGRARADGTRLLVVDADAARRSAIGRALWEAKPEAFLANGDADGPSPDRQPILLSGTCEARNGARFAVLADGLWREEGTGFERTILLFDDAGTPAARAVWRQFDGREDVIRGYFAQEDGKWVKKA